MALRIGLLGMWHVHAGGLVARLAAEPDCFQLVGGYDPDPAVVERRRHEWTPLVDGFRTFARPEDLLNEPLDAVAVEGLVDQNVGYARQAVESGRHVLLEKPAGTNLREFRGLLDAARARGLHVQMLYLFRYMAAVRELLRRAERGDFGPLYAFRGRLPKPLHEYAALADELGRYRGGVFFEMAGHILDLLVKLLGPPARIHAAMRHDHHLPPAAYVDNGAALVECRGGYGLVEVPGFEAASEQRRFELYGTEGAAVLPHLGSGHLSNAATQPLDVFDRRRGTWERLELPAAPLHAGDLAEFVAVVRGQRPPEFSPEHDLAVHRALLETSGMLDEADDPPAPRRRAGFR